MSEKCSSSCNTNSYTGKRQHRFTVKITGCNSKGWGWFAWRNGRYYQSCPLSWPSRHDAWTDAMRWVSCCRGRVDTLDVVGEIGR